MYHIIAKILVLLNRLDGGYKNDLTNKIMPLIITPVTLHWILGSCNNLVIIKPFISVSPLGLVLYMK